MSNSPKIKVFSGTRSRYMAEEICKELGIETLPPDELRMLYAQVDALHGNSESR